MVNASSAQAGRSPPSSALATAAAPHPMARIRSRREMPVCMVVFLLRAVDEVAITSAPGSLHRGRALDHPAVEPAPLARPSGRERQAGLPSALLCCTAAAARQDTECGEHRPGIAPDGLPGVY